MSIGTALRSLSAYAEKGDRRDLEDAIRDLQELERPKPAGRASDDSYLRSVLATAWRSEKGKKPKLYLDLSGNEVEVKLVFGPEDELSGKQRVTGDTTMESVRSAAEFVVRQLVAKRRGMRGDR